MLLPAYTDPDSQVATTYYVINKITATERVSKIEILTRVHIGGGAYHVVCTRCSLHYPQTAYGVLHW